MSQLADLFSRSTEGVFAVDVKERIVFWNEACEQLLGIPAQAAIGHACFDVVQAYDLAGEPFCKSGCCMSRLAKGGSATKPFPLRFGNGSSKLQKLSVCAVLVPSEQLDLWIVVHLLYRGESSYLCESLLQSDRQQPWMTQGRCAVNRTPLSSPLDLLTVRERRILRLLAEGHKSSVISQQLSISAVTVRNHIQHLNEKLGVHSQLEAVVYAYRHNLI